MQDWLTSNKRKRHQRALNKAMDRVNKVIAKDDLWRGRFAVYQIGGQWKAYDKLPWATTIEYYYWVQLVILDKKTGKFEVICDDSNRFCFSSHLFWEVNNFITEKCKVWENEGREELYERDKEDYTQYGVAVCGLWKPSITIRKPNGELIEGIQINW